VITSKANPEPGSLSKCLYSNGKIFNSHKIRYPTTRAAFYTSQQKAELGGLPLIFLLEQRKLRMIIFLPIGDEKKDLKV
jgi:hypothetical protein